MTIPKYMHYIELPLKLGGCWDWYRHPVTEHQIIINNVYLCMVLFAISKMALGLTVHLYIEWMDVMSSLDQIADSLPLLVSLIIISYHAIYREDLYDLMDYMNKNFKYNSARGLTNSTMQQSYVAAKKFAKIYTACTMFSVTMYATLPVLVYLWTKEPITGWLYSDVSQAPFIQFCVFLNSLLAQWFVGLAMGQFGVFFGANAILICGQLDLLCCSVRNVRYTALLQAGIQHSSLAAVHGDILEDERHSYVYNHAEMVDSKYHYDDEVNTFGHNKTKFDIYDPHHNAATLAALTECARLYQVVTLYKKQFERFASPLLVLRVVQVTLYLCTLLYAATLKFDMATVEYLAAVALDIFVYCYYGNQIILQADRVSTAVYGSSWAAMDVRCRRAVLNLLLANRRPVVVRAGRFLPMDLHTFILIIKTSFSYYTLLVNVNEK